MYQHKRGDTFNMSGQVDVTDNGIAIPDLTGWTGSAQIRTLDDVLVADLEFTWLNAATRTCKLYKLTTTAWPIGIAEIDIQLTNASAEIVSTETVQIEIVKDVTRAA